uniref:Larvicidal toxin 51 kDa protein n=1 Tax=Lygus hesperus TaxID=30085 RepID=A0A0A9WY92_LYGHE
MDAVVNTGATIIPECGKLAMSGSLHITKTTLVMFRNNTTRDGVAKGSSSLSRVSEAASENIYYREGENEEPVFLGVCSIPLIQFHRDDNTSIVLLRGNALLFDNAATSTSLHSNVYPDDTYDDTTGKKQYSSQADELLHTPASWHVVKLTFHSIA